MRVTPYRKAFSICVHLDGHVVERARIALAALGHAVVLQNKARQHLFFPFESRQQHAVRAGDGGEGAPLMQREVRWVSGQCGEARRDQDKLEKV